MQTDQWMTWTNDTESFSLVYILLRHNLITSVAVPSRDTQKPGVPWEVVGVSEDNFLSWPFCMTTHNCPKQLFVSFLAQCNSWPHLIEMYSTKRFHLRRLWAVEQLHGLHYKNRLAPNHLHMFITLSNKTVVFCLQFSSNAMSERVLLLRAINSRCFKLRTARVRGT
jgi:hypothetical protein